MLRSCTVIEVRVGADCEIGECQDLCIDLPELSRFAGLAAPSERLQAKRL